MDNSSKRIAALIKVIGKTDRKTGLQRRFGMTALTTKGSTLIIRDKDKGSILFRQASLTAATGVVIELKATGCWKEKAA